MLQKSYQNNKASLYIVPTPIGNLEDITLRAKRVLSEVDAIFAEDTRVTLELLNKLKIKNNLYTCQKFNEVKASIQMIELLESGKNIAIVTDRGTPLISDPGNVAIKKIIERGYNIIALPGACAFIPALNMSGLDQDKFIFYGFLNSKESQAIQELCIIKKFSFTTVLYEAPHRLYKTLQIIYKVLGNINISISREITKLYEEVFRGTVKEALETYKNEVKGEIVIVLDKCEETVNFDKIIDEAKELINLGLKNTNALKFVSKKYNVSKNELYDLMEAKK